MGLELGRVIHLFLEGWLADPTLTGWLSRPALLCLLLTCHASNVAGQTIAGIDSPNIVFILVDDQGWTGTSLEMDKERGDSKSDYYQTPAFEKLAHEGMRFSNAYASSPICSPTRASLQTGKNSAQLHITDIIGSSDTTERRYKALYTNKKLIPPLPRSGLDPAEITIAEYIKENRSEYKTAHFGKWHLGSGGPGSHGYDEHDGDTANLDDLQEESDPKKTFSVSKRAMEFMSTQARIHRPFFMQVSYYAVHLKIRNLKSTQERYESFPKGQNHNDSAYAAMTEDLDTGVGQVLEKIKELGIADNTYVIYFSDNGAYMSLNKVVTSNLPLAKGKCFVWEGGIRVPLVIKGPGIQSNTQSDVPVVAYDFFPTIKSILNIKAPLPAGLEGGDLMPLLTTSENSRVARLREEIVWHFPHYVDSKGVTPQSAIRMGDFKLIHMYETGEDFLYNLKDDLGETKNLAKSNPAQARSLREKLDQYLEAIDAGMPTSPPHHNASDSARPLPAL